MDNSLGQVTAAGMQFAGNGYVVTGDPITMVETNPDMGQTIIHVGDGTAAGAAYTATINSVLQGTTQLTKTDLGTLVLSGNNTYTGGTSINGGTLQVSADTNLGAMAGNLSLDGGTLASTASFSNGRATTLNTGGGTFDVAGGTTLTMNGEISGIGGLTKIDSGTLVLAGTNNYAGNTAITAGVLQAGAANTLSANSVVNVASAGTLNLSGLNQTIAGLSNAGLVNMGTGTTPGTILTVNGNLTGNGSAIVMNTYLGGDNSSTDRLMLNGGHASGNTALIIKHASGNAAQTNTGILLVQTQNGATTDTNAFNLSASSDGYRHGVGTIVAGPYDYALRRSGNGGVADSWYLTSVGNTCSTNVTLCPPQPSPPQPSPPQALLRPEVGSYLENRYFASTMLFHSLHDRQSPGAGLLDNNLNQSSNENSWVRIVGQVSSRNGADSMDISDTSFLIHGGRELARFNVGEQDNVRVGAMAAYGYSSNRADNGSLSSGGSVDGYSVGVYGTWYGNRDILSSPYVDSWIMFGHFYNTVSGPGLPTESYNANSVAASFEAGAPFWIYEHAGIRGFIEPQAQVIVSNYSASNHMESNGTVVSGQFSNNVTTRLGVRVHGNFDSSYCLKQMRTFAELNWRHGPASQSLTFDGIRINDGLPANRFEGKIDLQGNLTKALTVRGSIGVEVGTHAYTAGTAQLSIKYSW